MSAVTHDIVAKLWNLCNVLKDDGVTYHQYVTELTYLLFLKMAKETGTEKQIHQRLDMRVDTQLLGFVTRLQGQTQARKHHVAVQT